MDRPVFISAEQVTKRFGATQVLDDLSLDIYKGEFLTIFGPNGSGKSTLLNIIAGVEPYDSGTITIHSDSEPTFGFIFQDYRGNLMPWLSVADNIAFPLRIRGVPRNERLDRVNALKDRFKFQVDLSAATYSLSGGQAQLTSILRALVIDPDILIMDEPFSALDYQTNLGLYEKLLQVWDASDVTVVLISHNIDEALYRGERTVFLSKRPARVKEILPSDLGRVKDISQITTPKFGELKKQALEIFAEETSTGV